MAEVDVYVCFELMFRLRIEDDLLRRRMARNLEKLGVRVQFSVFELRIGKRERQETL